MEEVNENDNQPSTSKSCRNTESDEDIIKAREEYMKSLRQWIEEARAWYRICSGFPQYCNNNQAQSSGGNIPRPEQSVNHINQSNQTNQNDQNNLPQQPNFFPNFPNFVPGQPNIPYHFSPAFHRATYEFTIPPLWKRLVAEFLDFLILFIIKLFLTFCVLEILSFEHYGLDTLQKNFQNPKMAMQMSVEILILEVVHRILVCLYEAYWLKGGQCATPGKRYMGLMVIRADTVVAVQGRPEGTVRVQPCTPLGLQKALIRALLKNLFIGLMLPICFALYVFRFNRTVYDILASSLVVEWNHNLPFRPVD